MCVYIYIFIYLFVYLFMYLIIYLFIYLFIWLFVYLAILNCQTVDRSRFDLTYDSESLAEVYVAYIGRFQTSEF